jgi:uncharacterized protein involved in response to NO
LDKEINMMANSHQPASGAGLWIGGALRIPELLRKAPQTRPVLDRYGLKGCGGAEGPAETLEFFARSHDVPLPGLLDELRRAAEGPAESTPPPTPGPADAIYRPFFKAGIAVVLTLGAVWGAYLLLRIGFTGKFAAAGLHEVNAHGHAQIFGWVGLFVMGFACQAFPRFKHTTLAFPRLALASLVLMLLGIVGRSVGEPLAGAYPWLVPVAVSSSVLEVVAIGLFVWVIAVTWRRSGKGLAFYDGYLIASLFWFVVQAVYETVYLAATLSASGREELLGLVATWQGPLREVQIHGFALLMILGVSQRIFHPFYGLPAPRRTLSLVVLVLLNLAVVGEVAGFLLMRGQGRTWAALWYGSTLLLAGSVVALVRSWRIFSRPSNPDRSLKFLRAAYTWLFVSLAMLVLLPFYQRGLLPWLAPGSEAAHTGFSHAYYGAIRHAITVGFVSLMIVGVAAKVVPTLNGVDVHALSRLWLPFVLLNAGCALRVTGQVLTDFTPAAFPFAGVSGLLEVTGLAVWGVHLWAVMNGRARVSEPWAPPDPLLPGVGIRPSHHVGEVLDLYPHLLPVFVARGFTPLENALFRRLLARHTTIARACRTLGVHEAELLKELNRSAGLDAGRASLPVLNPEDHDQGGACCSHCAH